jgi:hypothetical protein
MSSESGLPEVSLEGEGGLAIEGLVEVFGLSIFQSVYSYLVLILKREDIKKEYNQV